MPVDDLLSLRLYSTHIPNEPIASNNEEAITDGYVSRRTLESMVSLPSKAQTAILRTLAELGPLDSCTGDALVAAFLAFAATDAVRDTSAPTLRAAGEIMRQLGGEDVDIDLLRTIAEAPTDFHRPLLELLLAARPIGTLSATSFFLGIWDEVQSHRTRTLWCGDIKRIAHSLALGPRFDDIVLRFLASERNDRGEVMDREVRLRLSAPSDGNARIGTAADQTQ